MDTLIVLRGLADEGRAISMRSAYTPAHVGP